MQLVDGKFIRHSDNRIICGWKQSICRKWPLIRILLGIDRSIAERREEVERGIVLHVQSLVSTNLIALHIPEFV